MKVVFSARGRADLLAQTNWLSEQTPLAARKAAARIQLQLALLAEFPISAPMIDKDHREATIRFGRDGFIVRYRVEGDTLKITRLFHGKQHR